MALRRRRAEEPTVDPVSRRGPSRSSRDPVERHGWSPEPAVVGPGRPRTRPPLRDALPRPTLEWPLPGEKLPLDEPVAPPSSRSTERAQAIVRRKLGNGLVPGEKVLVAQHRHPVLLVEPVLTSVAALVAVGWVSDYLGDLNVLRGALMVGWLALVGRAFWRYVEWSYDWFVVTDRRLLRLHGVLDSKRDMMPLMKVTDMAFERPFWGKLFGYGQFVLESAGRDQALREIRFVRDSERAYELICLQIFARPPFQAGDRPTGPGGSRLDPR
ncbi:PH domain-containing protein [Jannaschia sp. R86511]|uniref:PH domain-containing protein n=1 Tax=Jannaschia sp. R86511 TaxID=3093853 RepID=UPI0036D41983